MLKQSLEKLAKETKLSKEQIEGIIVYNHYINNYEKQLKTISLNINLDNPEDVELHNRLKVVSKALKVDKDAIIGYSIMKYLESESKCVKNLTKPSTKKTTQKLEKQPKKSSKITK